MVEIIRPGASSPDAQIALFDFDGTLSLIRTGWIDVMVPMMVEILAELKTGETEDQLRSVVEDYVWHQVSSSRRSCQDAEPLRGTTAHENRSAPG